LDGGDSEVYLDPPPFDGATYVGEIRCRPPNRGPVSFVVEYDVRGNFSRDLASLQRKLGTGDRDYFEWLATADWKEVMLQFKWGPGFWLGEPRVYITRPGGTEQEYTGKGWDRASWTLRLPDVREETRLVLRWRVLPGVT
jgi:hypothetical protein